MRVRILQTLWAILFGAVVACTGQIDRPEHLPRDLAGPDAPAEGARAPDGSPRSASDPAGGAPERDGDDPSSRPEVTPADAPEPFPGTERAATPSRLWRLTWVQYDNAASELLGEPIRASEAFDPELLSGAGYLNEQRFLEASDNLALQFGQAAEQLAARMAAEVTACAVDDSACASAFVVEQGRRIFRRPLTDVERDRYVQLFLDAAGDLGADAAVTMVFEALLRSPYFLFRFEVGDADERQGGDLVLTSHEIASALSFSLWNAPPDETLSALADAGELRDPDTRERQARRLAMDTRAVDTLYDFLSQWLGFFAVADAEKDSMTFPEWSPATGLAMLEETRSFVADVLDAGGGFPELMTARHTFPGADLDWVYGRETDGRRIESDQRRGLLMQPSFLAAHAKQAETSPTARGVFAVKRLGCFEPPPPDPNVAANPPPPDRTLTTRQRFELHQSDPVCATCHQFFDPIGLAFESFDAVGRFRTHEHDIPLDLTGELPAGVIADDALEFKSASDVAVSAAHSPAVHACFVRNLFQYIYGREPLETDDPILRDALATFVDSDHDPRELLFALVNHPEFVLRHPTE